MDTSCFLPLNTWKGRSGVRKEKLSKHTFCKIKTLFPVRFHLKQHHLLMMATCIAVWHFCGLRVIHCLFCHETASTHVQQTYIWTVDLLGVSSPIYVTSQSFFFLWLVTHYPAVNISHQEKWPNQQGLPHNINLNPMNVLGPQSCRPAEVPMATTSSSTLKPLCSISVTAGCCKDHTPLFHK